MKRPSFQFYPADWRRDAALQSCSVAARGLWIELMCVMHDCEPYGVLAVNGRPMSSTQIARIVGESERVIARLLADLEDAGVCSRDAEGRLFSRRMVKDEGVRDARAAGGFAGAEHGGKGGSHGKKGGRPRKQDGGFDAGAETPLEVSKIPPPSSSSSSSASAMNTKEPTGSVGRADHQASPQPAQSPAKTELPRCDVQAVVDLYHEILPELPSVRLMNDQRRKAVSTFWKFVLTSRKSDGTPRASSAPEAMDWIRGYFNRARDNDFLMGRGYKAPGHEGWSCDFDFLLTENGKKQVIERTKEAA
jgi:hypothetical protein